MSGTSDTSAIDIQENLLHKDKKNEVEHDEAQEKNKENNKKNNPENDDKKLLKEKNEEYIQQKLIDNLKEIKLGDLDVIPPNFKLAEKHRNVLRLYDDEQEQLNQNEDDQTDKNQENNKDIEAQNNNQQQNANAQNEDEDDDKQCSCCGRLKIDFKLNMKSDIIDFSFLGPAYPLFFNFLKMVYIMIFIIFATSGLINILLNAKSGESCQDGIKALQQLIDQGYTLQAAKKQIQNMCQLNWISQFTLGNRRNEEKSLLIQEYLNLFTIVALIIFIQYMQIQFRIQSLRIDIKTTTPSDYTVFITQIQKKMNLLQPRDDNKTEAKENKDKTKLAQFKFYSSYKKCFEGYLKDTFKIDGKIFRLSFCYNLDELNMLLQDKVKLLREIDQLQNKLKELEYDGDYDQVQEISDTIDDKMYEKDRKHTRINEIQNKFYNSFVGEDEDLEFMRYNFVGQAFLSFNTQDDAKEFLKETKMRSKKELKFQGKLLQFEQAPDPTDICWNNLYTTKTVRKLRIGLGFFMNMVMIFLAGLAIYALADVQYSYTKSNSIEPNNYEKFVIQMISIGISVFITVINEILVRIVEKINQLKKFRMKTSEQTSFMIILCATQFFNSTVIPLLLLIMVSSADSYYSILYSPTGLILNQNSIFMTTAFMPLLMTFLLDPNYRFKQFSRQRQLNLGKQNKCTLTQREAQELFQDPEFQLSIQYASSLKVIFMMFFYVSVMPLCMVWSIAALIIQYFISKYLLIYRRVILVSYGTKLSQSSLIILKIGLIIYSSTAYLFFKLSNSLDRPYIPSIIGIVISIINFMIPLEFFSEKIFKIDEDQIYDEEDIDKDKTLTYEEAIVKEFSTDYAIENPALKRKLINSEDYKINRKSIQKLKISGKKKVKRNQQNAIEENCKLQEQDQKVNIYDLKTHLPNNVQNENNNQNILNQSIKPNIKHQQNENTEQLQQSFSSVLFNKDIKLKDLQMHIEMSNYSSIQNKDKDTEFDAYKENIKQLSMWMFQLQKQNKSLCTLLKLKYLKEDDKKNIKLNDELFIKAHQKLQNYRKHFNISEYIDEKINQIIQFCDAKNDQKYNSNNINSQIDQLFDYQDWLYKHFIALDRQICQSQLNSQQNFNIISQSEKLIKKLSDKKIEIIKIIESRHKDLDV
ncbi:hypothetical protein ABPG73_000391 [Tetrahymena malaccensis]